MKAKSAFTGYFGMWSAVSKQFVFGIQELSPRKARQQLWKYIGWDAAKYRFSAKKIRDCQLHREMFRCKFKTLKHEVKTPRCNGTLEKNNYYNYITKREEICMNIKITIEAPELVSAINKMADALGGMSGPVAVTNIAQPESTKKVSDEGQAVADKKAADEKKAIEAAEKKKIAEERVKAEEKAKKEAEEKAKAEAEKAEAESAATKEEPTPLEKANESPAITLEVVRGKLAELAAEGRAEQQLIQEAVNRYGKKLSDVPAEHYAELLNACGLSV